MSGQEHFDLIVIGSGAAGSACWFSAVAEGRKVAVFEEDALGGECANFACVPTKALLHAANVLETVRGAGRFGVRTGPVSFDYPAVARWKAEVLSETGAALGRKPYEDAGVELIQERAKFISDSQIQAGGRIFSAERFLVSTGAGVAVPPIPGLDEAGYLTFREAVALSSIPQSLLIIGSGAVGCEFAQLFGSFGSDVVLADQLPRLLPREDSEAGDFLAEHFRSRGVRLALGATILDVTKNGSRKRVRFNADGEDQALDVDDVLIASGKRPNTDIGLDVAGVEFNSSGILVDERLRTSNARVFAAGDVVGPFRLTHAASYQGQVAYSNMFSKTGRRVNYAGMPRCVFTTPEVAAVGLTEVEAREGGRPLRVGRADLVENDRGLTSAERAGFVKVIATEEGRLLGGVAVAPYAGEFMHELALAVSLGASCDDIAGVVHAFPTFSEALASACANVGEPA